MRKECLDLMNLGTRGYIKVFGLDSKQSVADTASRQVGRKAVLTQCLNNRSGMLFVCRHLDMVTCQASGINGAYARSVLQTALWRQVDVDRVFPKRKLGHDFGVE